MFHYHLMVLMLLRRYDSDGDNVVGSDDADHYDGSNDGVDNDDDNDALI